ncbi:uncharacterized protein [Mytilus edulis]|uniref:uncharacterized protein n=1 Tax=Mytilus edulis TaxID=6550 RepID=UPI0039EF6FE5
MVKRKREDTDTDLKDASQCHPKMASLIGMASRLTTPSVLSAAETELRTVMDDFVTVYERLDQEDKADKKPNYSYTEMIYLSILRSPNFCLPITEIYKYIRNRFSYFRSSARKHWCNAVRHSLSKTKCFTKIAIGRGSSGNHNLNRSTYLWCIVPGSIVNFARGDYRPNVDSESGTNTLRWGYFRVNAGQFWDQVAVYLEKKMEIFQQMILATQSPGKVLEAQACFIPGLASTVPIMNSPQSNAPTIVTNKESADNPFGTKQDIPTRTVHYGPNLSDSGILDQSIPKMQRRTVNNSRDSGNESFSDSSPEEKRQKQNNLPSKGCGLNASYLTVNSSILDDTRKTPELPDLGHVSPLSISPSLSPITGNVTYDNDTFAGSSYSSTFPSVPASFASTPVVTSFSQQRFSQAPSVYTHSFSPPLFPSLSPPTFQVPMESPACYPQFVQTNSKPLTLPYLQSSMNSPMNTQHNMFLPRAYPQPPMYIPHQVPAGSYDFGQFPVPPISHTPYQYESYGCQSSENQINYLQLSSQNKFEQFSGHTLASVNWNTT